MPKKVKEETQEKNEEMKPMAPASKPAVVPEKKTPVSTWTKKIWAVATLIAFVALIFLVDYVVQREKPAPTGTAGVDTSSWEQYTNDIYGFSFRMPPGWGQYNVTKASRTENKDSSIEFTYNYFHFEYPKIIDDTASGNVFFEIGVFSPTSWTYAKNEWKLLGTSDGAIFGSRSSEKNLATGLEERWEEIETIQGTFLLAVSSPNSSSNADVPTNTPQLE